MSAEDDELARLLAKKLTEVLGDAFPPTAHAVKFLPSPHGTIRAELTLLLGGLKVCPACGGCGRAFDPRKPEKRLEDRPDCPKCRGSGAPRRAS